MFKLLLQSKPTLFAFLSNVSYTFAIWFMAVLINHYYGAKALGEYSFIQAVVSPLAIFFHLQLKVLATMEVNIKSKFSQYVSVFIVSEFIFLIFIGALGIYLEQSMLFYAFAVLKIFESLNSVCAGYHQSKNDFFTAFTLTCSRSIVVLVILWSFLEMDLPVHLSFFAISFFWLLFVVFYDLPKIRKDKCKIHLVKDTSKLKPLILSGASLSIISCLDLFVYAIPRYFINGYLGEEELGKFTMVLQFFIASTIFVVSVGHPFLVKLKNHLENNDLRAFKKEVKKTILVFMTFSVLIIAFFMLAGKLIMRLTWGAEYESLSNYLSLSMIAIIPLFLSSIFVYAVNSLGYLSIHMKYYPIIVLTALVLSYFLVPEYGIAGGVITIILTQFCRLFLSGIALKYCLTKETAKFAS